jgi:hypothetical protein
MINQEINLYQDRFKEKKLLLSAQHSLVLLGVVILALMVSSYFYADMTQQEQLRLEQNSLQKTQSTQRMELLQKKMQELLANDQLDRKIAQVSKDIKVRKRMIDFVDNNQFGSGEGFSKDLAVLAELPGENLWLNQISLAANYIKLSGSALNAQSVPEYFNQFQSRDLFEGHVFDVFELGREAQRDWKVDFVIASREVSDE